MTSHIALHPVLYERPSHVAFVPMSLPVNRELAHLASSSSTCEAGHFAQLPEEAAAGGDVLSVLPTLPAIPAIYELAEPAAGVRTDRWSPRPDRASTDDQLAHP